MLIVEENKEIVEQHTVPKDKSIKKIVQKILADGISKDTVVEAANKIPSQNYEIEHIER